MSSASPAPERDDGLAGTQRWLFESLVFPGRVDDEQVERRLLASPKLDARARLGIYQRAYILRLCKCLAEQFPALCHALGEELFHDFAREYLWAHPPSSYTLHELGRRFSGYLDHARPDRDLPPAQREDWIDFMVDLARYEFEQFRLFDAPGHEGKPWPTVDTPDERLVLQPAFVLETFRYPVAWYYHQVRAEQDPSFPSARTSHVAIVRKDFMTSTVPLNRVHHVFLSTLRDHGTVGEALQWVAQEQQRSLAEVERSWHDEVRGRWIAAGFFIERGSDAAPA
ncbi:MAG: DNA-binding domain-containing protein [Myxococcota bacterium]